MRPDWQTSRYNDEKINLSNNVCYDKILLDQVNELIKTKDFNVRQYPDEYIIYKSISKYHNVDTKNISVGYGLGELIIRVLNLKKIKKLSIISPTWTMVEVFCKINNINHTTEFDLTANSLYIANPNGIDGTCLTKLEMIELISKFELVIVDEAYGEFATIEYSVLELASLYDNLIVLKTFSKSLGLAGLRLGYAISNTKIIYELQIHRPSCITNGILLSSIDELYEMIPEHVNRMNETKQYIESNFDCIKSHGNYVLLKSDLSSITDNFIIKLMPNGIKRMALTNLHLFKNAITNIRT